MDPARLGIHGCSAGASLAIGSPPTDSACGRCGSSRPTQTRWPWPGITSRRGRVCARSSALTSRFAVGRAVAQRAPGASLTGDAGASRRSIPWPR
jgi:hypothetical protein